MIWYDKIIWIWWYIDPIWVEDENGSEEEDEEGGWNVNQSDRCSSLQFHISTLWEERVGINLQQVAVYGVQVNIS